MRATADDVYDQLQRAGLTVLYDDRLEASAGEKFHDADLLGLPWRAVVSGKTGRQIELRARAAETTELVTLSTLIKRVTPPSPHV